MVQNHIHLADTLTGTPEYAPTHKWKTVARESETAFFSAIRYTPSGAAYLHVVKTAGVPVVRYNYDYTLLLRTDTVTTTDEKVALLDDLVGKHLYLVDHLHPANGADHTAYIREVAIDGAIRYKPGNPLLQFYTATISLRDIG